MIIHKRIYPFIIFFLCAYCYGENQEPKLISTNSNIVKYWLDGLDKRIVFTRAKNNKYEITEYNPIDDKFNVLAISDEDVTFIGDNEIYLAAVKTDTFVAGTRPILVIRKEDNFLMGRIRLADNAIKAKFVGEKLYVIQNSQISQFSNKLEFVESKQAYHVKPIYKWGESNVSVTDRDISIYDSEYNYLRSYLFPNKQTKNHCISVSMDIQDNYAYISANCGSIYQVNLITGKFDELLSLEENFHSVAVNKNFLYVIPEGNNSNKVEKAIIYDLANKKIVNSFDASGDISFVKDSHLVIIDKTPPTISSKAIIYVYNL